MDKERIMNMIDMGLLVELGEWKKALEEDSNLYIEHIVHVARIIKDKTEDMGTLSYGIWLELSRKNLLEFS